MNKYWVFFSLAILTYLLHVVISGHGIYGDGNGYFAYSHALYFEHKLDFSPIYTHLSHFQGTKYTFNRVFWDTHVLSTGTQHNLWTAGSSILWIPSLFIIDILTKLFNLHIDKFNTVFEIGPGITGIVLVLGGLFFLEKFITTYYSRKVATSVILWLSLGTQLTYYLFFEPALSHQPSFFFICLLLYLSTRSFSWFQIFSVGFYCGFLIISRIADTLLLIPIVLFFFQKWNIHQKVVVKIILFFVGLFFALTPQIFIQKELFGSWYHNPYIAGEHGRFVWDLKQMFFAFFGTQRGLFLWTPTLAISLFGLVFMRRKISTFNYISTIVILLLFSLYISMWTGVLSAGFGNRMFIGALPFFAVGMGSVFERLKKPLITIIIICSILWNLLLLVQFFLDKPRMIDGKGLTYENFISGQLIIPIKYGLKVFQK